MINSNYMEKRHEEIPLGEINARGKSLGALRKAQTQQVCACNLVTRIALSRYNGMDICVGFLLGFVIQATGRAKHEDGMRRFLCQK